MADSDTPGRAPLQDVLRRIYQMQDAGASTQEAVDEVKALGWEPKELKSRLAILPRSGSEDFIAQALTGGLEDEISAGIGAPLRSWRQGTSLADAYSQGLEERRAGLESYRRQHPVLATGSELAGGLALPAPSATGPLGAIAGQALTGAGMGALFGFGTGEGDFTNRAERAVAGGALGGAAGGALGLGEALYRGAKGLIPSGAEAFARSALGGALKDEGMTGAAAADAIAAARAAGSPQTTVTDVAKPGGGVTGLFEDITNSPNAAQAPLQQLITERQMGVRGPTGDMTTPGQYERVVDRLGNLSGIGGKRAVATLAEITKRRSASAAPLFKTANAFDTASDPAVRSMLTEVAGTPVFKDAWGRAIKIAQSRARGVPTPSLDSLVDQSGNLTAVPNMQFMHFLKEGMDDAVNAAYRAGDTNLGGAYKEVRNLFRDTLKTSNPAYKTALDAYAGESALQDALGEGASMMTKSADELTSAFDGLGASEQDAFRVGALTKVFDTLATPRRGPARDVVAALNSPAFIRKIAALMPDDAARVKWFAFADAEAAKSGVAGVRFNSATARRQEVSDAMGGEEQSGRMLAEAAATMHSGPWNMLMTALTKVSKSVAAAAKRQRRNALGNMLLKTDTEAEAMLRGLDAAPPRGLGYSTGGLLGPGAAAASGAEPPAPTTQDDLLLGP